MPVRNEDWCLGLSLSVALRWCDAVVVLDHASTDCTRQLLRSFEGVHGKRIQPLSVGSHSWDEMQHRHMMLLCAREHGATHIAIVDADEVLTGNVVHQIRAMVEALKPGHILNLPLYNLRGSIMRYHSNGLWSNRTVPVVFADSPELHWAGDHFHHREPKGRYLTPWHPLAQNEGGVFHLWGVSERRLRAKHRLYRIVERIRWPDKSIQEIERYYSFATKGGPDEDAATWTYATPPSEWWAPYSSLMDYLELNAEPWQEAECERLIKQYGQDYFSGLDLS
jgi:Glycosyl transferase family 2